MDSNTSQSVIPLTRETNDLLQERGVLKDIQLVARGGMSQIYRAYQPHLDRYIVIKRLREELTHSAETVERFRREAKSLASVLHQNVAHVYDFVENRNQAFILMEYIDGIDLSEVISKYGRLPAELSVAILLGVARGVAYIHAHNIIHRDIKPSNIRLTTHGEVKLMDFGIVMDVSNQGLTRPGMMVGSPSYLSPEQVLGENVSPKSDIFLMGICLYEMLTAAKPFHDEAGETVFQRIRATKYTPIREMQPNTPETLEKIAERCLAQDPSNRFENVRALITELEKFLGAEKTARTEDLILKFLDEEALIKPSVKYTVFDDSKKNFWAYLKSPYLLLVTLVVTLMAFGGGYFLGSRRLIISQILVGPPTPERQKNYPPSQSSKKSRPTTHSGGP